MMKTDLILRSFIKPDRRVYARSKCVTPKICGYNCDRLVIIRLSIQRLDVSSAAKEES